MWTKMGFFSTIGKVFTAIINELFPKTDSAVPHSSSANRQTNNQPVYRSYSSYRYGSSYREPTSSLYSYNESYGGTLSSTRTCCCIIDKWVFLKKISFILCENIQYLNFMPIDFLWNCSENFTDENPTSFLNLTQLKAYSLPNEILITERSQDIGEVPENISDQLR